MYVYIFVADNRDEMGPFPDQYRPYGSHMVTWVQSFTTPPIILHPTDSVTVPRCTFHIHRPDAIVLICCTPA